MNLKYNRNSVGSYTYDATNQLTSETKMKQNGHRMYYSYEYSFDPAGNRTALRRELHQQPVFAEGDKLKNENKNICGLEFSGHVCNHVSCENKKAKPSFWDLPGLMNFSYVYDKENRLLQVRAMRDETTYIADYEYDNNGNLA